APPHLRAERPRAVRLDFGGMMSLTSGRRKKVDTGEHRRTEEEFMRMPDDGRKYELVDGEAKEVPGGVEQDVIGAHLIVLFHPFTKGRGFLAASQAGFRMH